jgi:adenine-specific DNA-methyltransferase
MWAIRASTGRLLDPSAGGGVFLDAALEEYARRGRRGAGERVFGIEVAADAAELLRLRLDGIVPAANISTGDFFSVTVAECGRFHAIVANPPYIRHHALDKAQRRRARQRAQDAGIILSEQADAWAYFVAHSLTLLTDTGRAAFVLPGAILQADYAGPLLAALARQPGRAELIRVQSLLFNHVQERSVVLAIDRDAPDSQLAYREVSNVSELSEVLNPGNRPPKAARVGGYDAEPEERHLSLLPKGARDLWTTLVASPQVARLTSLAKIRIGTVTGANGFFVRSHLEHARLTGSLTPAVSVVSRSRWLGGLSWTADDVMRVAGERSRLLVLPADHVPNQALKQALRDADSEGLPSRSHCARRSPWWALVDYEAPDLFLPYMGGAPPRLIANAAGSTCTNAVHRVSLSAPAASAETLAISSWSTLYRLSAELNGRHYGGGVLKLEMRDAQNLVCVTESLEEGVAADVKELVAAAKLDAAQVLVDKAILNDMLGLSVADVRRLGRAAGHLQRRRLSG